MKLYYPEPDSARVVAAIRAKPVCYSPLHELDEYRVCPHVAFRNMGQHEREMRLRVVLR